MAAAVVMLVAQAAYAPAAASAAVARHMRHLRLQMMEPAPVDDLGAVKAELRLLAARGDRGFKASASVMDRLRVLTATLESAFPSKECPTESPLLLGDWMLDFTDAADVLSLGILPGAMLELGDIYQNVRVGSTATEFDVANVIELKPRGSALLRSAGLQTSGRYAVRASCQKLDGRRVSLIFTGAELQPFTSLLGMALGLPPLAAGLPGPAVDALRGLVGERVFLQTSYLDADMRVARGPSRELYVLSKP
mmetsp:Transcript_15123/g.49323  ORF Transcript_15123/g.49323 Transcript_15123/m.49323 type:complete len:251 (-) Transcript_15123:109-861(-)|eukprot:scaffold20088_cov122-Isochrysis_galbana.AAC.1